jgi:hypothetical protein
MGRRVIRIEVDGGTEMIAGPCDGLAGGFEQLVLSPEQSVVSRWARGTMLGRMQLDAARPRLRSRSRPGLQTGR